MISFQPTAFSLVLKDGKPIELTLEEAQELCAALMTTLAPTLNASQEADTTEAPLPLPEPIPFAPGPSIATETGP